VTAAALRPARFQGLACALPTLAGASLGLGAWVPGVVELLALSSLIAWVVLAQPLLRGETPPARHEVALACAGAAATGMAALAGGLGGFGCAEPDPLAELLRTPAYAMVGAAVLCFGALACAPLLRGAAAWAWDVRAADAPALTPSWSRAAWVVFGAGVLLQGAVFLAHDGPLVQADSWANVWGPPLFQHWGTPPHFTPLYAELVKLANGAPDPVFALTALVALQHAALLGVGLLVERTVRLTASSQLAGVCAGLLIVCCGHLALYAQQVMSEVLSIGWVTLATACLFAAPRSPTPQRWLVAGGLASALATLTRQAMQGWFVAGALAVACLGFPQRKRALLLYLAAALLPLAATIAHNGVFYGRPSLTASLGRNLYYRVTRGVPDLTDPSAEPGDPYEHARELIWEHRDGGWLDAYSAIDAELGWEDATIEQAMQRFYVEQALRHPVAFARVTLEYSWALLVARENPMTLLRFHNQVLPELPAWALPPADPEGWVARWVHAFQPTSSAPVLLLALLSPLLVAGRARVLALTALVSVAYFVVLTSLVELPVARYRLPTVPFLAIACGLGVGGLAQRARAWRRSPPEATP